MGRFTLSAIVGAALLVIPSAASFAADIPDTPYIPPPPVQIGGGWYLKGHIGLAAQHFKGLEHPLFESADDFAWLDAGHFAGVPTFGLGIGYQHSDKLRFDLTGEYRSKSAFKARDQFDNEGAINTNDYSGFKSEWLFLANAYYDIGTWHGITPYVGGGIGVSRNSIYNFTDVNVIAGGGGWAPTGHKWSLAWALHAGASMQVNERLSIDLGYSFVSLGDAQTGPFQNMDPNESNCLPDSCVGMNFKSLYSHDFKLGVRWALDHGGSYAPVVAKY